jgi:hypothetical protein
VTELLNVDDCPLYLARCCRDWPVFLGVRMRPCGYCGVVPAVICKWDEREG